MYRVLTASVFSQRVLYTLMTMHCLVSSRSKINKKSPDHKIFSLAKMSVFLKIKYANYVDKGLVCWSAGLWCLRLRFFFISWTCFHLGPLLLRCRFFSRCHICSQNSSRLKLGLPRSWMYSLYLSRDSASKARPRPSSSSVFWLFSICPFSITFRFNFTMVWTKVCSWAWQ